MRSRCSVISLLASLRRFPLPLRSIRTFAPSRCAKIFSASRPVALGPLKVRAPELVSNMDLGSQRAATLFRLVLGAMKRDEARSDSTEQYLLSKLAVRSYGQQRPVPSSRCAQLGSFGGDRRVTIAVEMTPMTSTEEVNDAR